MVISRKEESHQGLGPTGHAQKPAVKKLKVIFDLI
jgi:hypothetical protein